VKENQKCLDSAQKNIKKLKFSDVFLPCPQRETAVPAALILDKRNTKDPENRAKEALWLKNSM
jgi:hypothetical protein